MGLAQRMLGFSFLGWLGGWVAGWLGGNKVAEQNVVPEHVPEQNFRTKHSLESLAKLKDNKTPERNI